jgi:D-alanyl-D-alanine carboxypeptidase/D-alanyl-D-alanine-endopeptidase (penicillin-binding protein 4)
MTSHKFFRSFYNSLGEAGNPDDISSFKSWGIGTAIAMNARIKSGTINGVRSHSGYIKNKKGRLIAFSFIANNFSGSAREINEIHQKILISLALLN